MFSTVFIDISLIFVQLDLENCWKTVRDPPFYYLHKSTFIAVRENNQRKGEIKVK